MNIKYLKKAAKDSFSKTVEIRRDLHQHPEVSWQENRTIERLKRELEKLNSPKLTIYEKTGGLIADYSENQSYGWYLFRADVDALPIKEETGLEFSSIFEGKMHACGHDFHAAMLFGAINSIVNNKIPLKKNIRFVFQRAEEVPYEISGGLSLVNEGVLDLIESCFALHIDAKGDCGVLKSKEGKMLANPCHLKFKVKATGGHVARPEAGSNAIDIMVDLHLALKDLITNCNDFKDLVVFTPSISCAGTACNVMPAEGEVCYSLRNFLEKKTRDSLIKTIEEKACEIALRYQGGKIEDFTLIEGFPILKNNSNLYQKSKELFERGGFEQIRANETFAGEDFSYYLDQKPGVYWSIGAKQGQGYDHHTSRFDPDESMMWQGVLFWLLLATHNL